MTDTASARTVSLVMIVRDEERCLARCLDSVAHLVDEIVVVDTGSTDHTIAIAESYGAKVSHFDWIDDFSAARNFALDQATGDWRLVMDADEWLTAGVDALTALRETAPDFLGVLPIHAFAESPQGPVATTSWNARVLPRGVRYERPLHEQPVWTGGLVRLGVELSHDGFLDAQLARKGTRNLRILDRWLAAHPGDGVGLYQRAMELQAAGRLEEAVAAYARAWDASRPMMNYRSHLVEQWMTLLLHLGRDAEAIRLGASHNAEFVAEADFWFVFAEALAARAAKVPAEAAELLDAAVDCWRTCLDIGESDGFGFRHAVPGRGSWLAEERLEDALRRRAALASPGRPA